MSFLHFQPEQLTLPHVSPGSLGIMKLEPFEGIGPLRLGMSPEDVEVAVGIGGSFERGTSRFLSLRAGDAQVGLDEDGRVEFIEVYQPEAVELAGLRLIGESIGAVLSALADRGILPDEVEADEYYYFYEHGLTLTVEESLISACACFAEGYYSKHE